MARTKIANDSIFIEDGNTNLSAVTTATTGATIKTSYYKDKTFWVNVSVNTGAVTVNIQASNDGTTWYTLDSKTYTAVTGTDVFAYNSFFNYMRATTTTQSNSTVTVTLTGRS